MNDKYHSQVVGGLGGVGLILVDKPQTTDNPPITMFHPVEFRAKTLDHAKWIYGDLLTPQGSGTKYMIRHTDEDGKEEVEEIDVETVGQYTTWFDYEGERIYEGDFVECYYLAQLPGKRWPEVYRLLGSVVFQNGGFGIATSYLNEFGFLFPMQLLEFAEEIGELAFIIRNKDESIDYSGLPEYLKEKAKAKNLTEVVTIFNGIQKLGNIYDNPGLDVAMLESEM